MLVDKSAFPPIEGGQWKGPKVTDDPHQPDYPVEPPDCKVLYLGPKPTQTVEGSWGTPRESHTSVHQAFNVRIALTEQPPDLKSVLSKCGHFTVGRTRNSATPHSAQGLPDWAIAYDQADDQQRQGAAVAAIGFYRGVFIEMAYSKQGDAAQLDATSLVTAFNDQVAKLEAV